MNKVEFWLGAWTLLASVWWLIALKLVAQVKGVPNFALEKPVFFLTIFKPLSYLEEKKNIKFLGALESFFYQLDEKCELLLGLWEKDKEVWAPFLEKWASLETWKYVKVIWREEAGAFSNPKISWNWILSQHAQKECWLWSDADIIVPPDFLNTVRFEFSKNKCDLLTSSYVIRRLNCSANILEALFVNVELLPGIFILNFSKKKTFGFGASLLFRAKAIKSLWNKLGNNLADDFVLGQSLGNSQLSQLVVETLPQETKWKRAITHYLRWQKTIRWVQPLGFAAQIVLFPLLGWIIFSFFSLSKGFVGGALTLGLEAFFAISICRKLRCIISWRYCWSVIIWCVVRSIGWVICWLPWPVKWGKKWWWSKATKVL